MKKLIVLLAIIALFGCEKERCWECTTTCTAMGYSSSSTQVYCGDYSKSEVKKMASASMTTSGAGYSCKVNCKEK